MPDVFVITNQLGHFWGKSKQWVDGKDPRTILRARHQDEAVNTLVDLSTKDMTLRGQVIEVPLSQRGEPVVTVSDIPVPQIEESPSTDDLQTSDEASPSALVTDSAGPA